MTDMDIICIGAINYDYMFHCTGEDLRINEISSGDEKLSNPISEVEDDISELIRKRSSVYDSDRRICLYYLKSNQAYPSASEGSLCGCLRNAQRF